MADFEALRHSNAPAGFSDWRSGGWYENALVTAFSLAAGLVFLDRLGIVFVFPQIQHDLGLDHAQLGMLMGIASLAWALSSIVVSFVSDALGGRAKIIIVICVIGFSCATGLIAVATSFAALLAVRAIAGMFFGPTLPLILSAVAKSSSPRRLGANVGAVGVGMVLLGNALAPVLIVVLAHAFGWHRAFLYLALPGLLLAAILAVIVRPDASPNGAAPPATDRASLREAAGLLANRNIILALVGGLALIGFLLTFASFSPLFLAQDHTISTAMRTVLLTMIGLAGAVGGLFAPTLSDRLRRKTCALMATGCTMLLPAMLILMRAHHAAVPLVLATQFVAGGAMPMVVFIIPGQSVPRRLMTTAFALPLSFGELLGGSTTPAIAGMLSDHFGLTSAMWFCCGLGALSVIAVLAMREPPRRDDTAAEDLPLRVVGEPIGQGATPTRSQ